MRDSHVFAMCATVNFFDAGGCDHFVLRPGVRLVTGMLQLLSRNPNADLEYPSKVTSTLLGTWISFCRRFSRTAVGCVSLRNYRAMLCLQLEQVRRLSFSVYFRARSLSLSAQLRCVCHSTREPRLVSSEVLICPRWIVTVTCHGLSYCQSYLVLLY